MNSQHIKQNNDSYENQVNSIIWFKSTRTCDWYWTMVKVHYKP